MRSQTNHRALPIYLIAVYLPIFLFIASLRIQRGLSLGSIDSLYSALLYVLVDLSLIALFASLVHTLMCQVSRPLIRGTALFTVYFLTITVVLIESLSHELFTQTGLILNWPLFLFGLERSEMLLKAVEQQVSFSSKSYLIALILYLIVVPFWFIKRTGDLCVAKHRLLSTGMAVSLLLGYVTLHVFSSTFGLPREEFRDASSHLLLSYFDMNMTNSNQPLSLLDNQINNSTLPIGGSVNNRINVAIIILESTREKSVAPYVDTPVTPYLLELSDESLVMQHAYSTSPHTSRAIYSILCGRFPRAGKGISETLENGITQHCLPHLLDQQGYATAYFQSATEDFENRAQLIKNMGFSSFFPLEKLDTTDFEKSNYFGYEDNVMLPASKEWLAEQEQPFLSTYLTVTPHFYYDEIKRYGWRNYDTNKKYNAYLNTLHYQDNFLKNLIQQYKDLGLYENTLFVILGDHGEGFREHRLWGHGNILYEEGVKVPFILHYTNKLIGKVDPRVSLLDVVPSILSVLAYDGLDDMFDGRDVQQISEQRDVLLECVSPRQCSSLIDAQTGLKLIHNYERKSDKLFDLTADAKEKNNLADNSKFQTIRQELLNRLKQKIDEVTDPNHPKAPSGWAYNPSPAAWSNELPTRLESFQNRFTIKTTDGKETTGILQISTSKNHVYPGDSFSLSYTLNSAQNEICIESLYTGIKRHKQRTRNVKPNGSADYAYFTITENLQVLTDASKIEVDISIKSECSKNASTLSQNILVIDLLQKERADVAPSIKHKQSFLRQPLPANKDELESSKYLNNILEYDLPVNEFNISARPALLSTTFVESLRNRLVELQPQYGVYQTKHLESVWQNSDDRSSFIYRYRIVFSANRSMDFRVHVENLEIVALYYYHPWKNNRPL